MSSLASFLLLTQILLLTLGGIFGKPSATYSLASSSKHLYLFKNAEVCPGGDVRPTFIHHPSHSTTSISESSTPSQDAFDISLKLLKKKYVKDTAKLCVDVFFGGEKRKNALEYTAPGGIFDTEYKTCLAHLRSGLENSESQEIDFFVAEASSRHPKSSDESERAESISFGDDGITRTSTSTSTVMKTTTQASEKKRIVGFAELSLTADHCFLLSDVLGSFKEKRLRVLALAVDEQFRRRGVGSSLIKTCLKRAAQKGYEEVILEVRSDNPSAAKFYQKLGFVKMFDKPVPGENYLLGIYVTKIADSLKSPPSAVG